MSGIVIQETPARCLLTGAIYDLLSELTEQLPDSRQELEDATVRWLNQHGLNVQATADWTAELDRIDTHSIVDKLPEAIKHQLQQDTKLVGWEINFNSNNTRIGMELVHI